MSKPIACSRCGALRQFDHYGEKMGKDGRMAKWPVYKPCDSDICKTQSNAREKPAPQPATARGSWTAAQHNELVHSSTELLQAGSTKGTLLLVDTDIERVLAELIGSRRHARAEISVRSLALLFPRLVLTIPALDGSDIQIDVTISRHLTPSYPYLLLLDDERKETTHDQNALATPADQPVL